MQTKKIQLLGMAALVVVVLLAACNLPTTPAPPHITPPVTPIVVTNVVPVQTCDSAHMGEVTQVSPPDYSVVDSLTPELAWSYAMTTLCQPDHYELKLSTGPFFEDNLGAVDIPAAETHWAPSTPLEPATEYAWSIRAIGSDGDTGSLDGYAYFFTGPRCSGPDVLVAPVLLSPANGDSYDDSRQSIMWEYPDPCLPDAYRIDVSPALDFSDTTLSGSTHSPSTRWGIGREVIPCQIYYWRVAAVMGSTLGPYSETRHFLAAPPVGGDCAPWGRIEGIVWHDLCAVPEGPAPDPPPAGCVRTAEGSLRADGVRQDGEPGIEGVKVGLYVGGCGGTLFATTLTDADGHYAFSGLPEGSFCVQVDPLAGPNESILLPGEWTHPLTEGVATQVVSAMPEETRTADFGWDYQLLPEPSATPTPMFHAAQNVFCRQGPSKAYPKMAVIPQGAEVPIEGRLANNAAFYVYWAQTDTRCWVAAWAGEAANPDLAPVVTPPPPPTPADTEPPTITDVHALNRGLYYGNNAMPSCGDHVLEVAARISDDGGVSEGNIYLEYRYLRDGKASGWYTAPVHDRAAGNQYGFMVNISTKEALNFMRRYNGYVEFRVVAVDDAGRRAASEVQQVRLTYCKQ